MWDRCNHIPRQVALKFLGNSFEELIKISFFYQKNTEITNNPSGLMNSKKPFLWTWLYVGNRQGIEIDFHDKTVQTEVEYRGVGTSNFMYCNTEVQPSLTTHTTDNHKWSKVGNLDISICFPQCPHWGSSWPKLTQGGDEVRNYTKISIYIMLRDFFKVAVSSLPESWFSSKACWGKTKLNWQYLC